MQIAYDEVFTVSGRFERGYGKYKNVQYPASFICTMNSHAMIPMRTRNDKELKHMEISDALFAAIQDSLTNPGNRHTCKYDK